MRLSLVAAVDQNLAIGHGNRLPWHISGDLRFFRSLTWGHRLLMGRATFDSLDRRALPGRRSLVLSRAAPEGGWPGVDVAASLDAGLAMCAGEEEVFIIGGASVYAEALGQAQRMYLTEINGRFAADRWFPEFDPSRWTCRTLEDHWSELPYGWRIRQYDKGA